MNQNRSLLNSHTQFRRAVRRLFRGLPFPLRQRLNAFRRAHEKPLRTMLPLPLPETIHLDPTNACNFRCVFCPTSDNELLKSVGRPKGVMDFDLFVKIIDDLKVLVRRHKAPLTALHLYKDGEPLLNKRFPEMAAYARKAEVAHTVSTTSNGSLLTEELALKLIDCGLDQIRISVIHLNDQRYRELTQTFGDYEKVKRNVSFLYHEAKRRNSSLKVLVKINDSDLSLDEKKQFAMDFGRIADGLIVDTMMGWSHSEMKDFTLGIPVITGMDSVSPLRERQVCPEPFSRLAINFDGQVSVCCVDWSYGTIVGDLRKQSLEEIWNGELLREFRLKHLQGQRGAIPACANCQYLLGEQLSRDLDDHVASLLPLYQKPEGERQPS